MFVVSIGLCITRHFKEVETGIPEIITGAARLNFLKNHQDTEIANLKYDNNVLKAKVKTTERRQSSLLAQLAAFLPPEEKDVAEE